MSAGVRTSFPCPVREIRHTWIGLADGCRLGARIWLPEDAEEQPVPAVLEYIPYRKDDFTAERDAAMHAYVAGHGYASVRVDLRGSGSSDGVIRDEYLPQEQEDAEEVIAWLAAQPWCSGAVGMIGISWGGFNALQVAARRPPALKAIVTLCSTDDRYADDVHYTGGCVGFEMISWSTTMLARAALPPLPPVVGAGWREAWRQRLEAIAPWVETWLAHQRRDAYWKQGSVGEAFGAIECAVYAVGGWADGYTNAIPRLLAGLTCPRKGLIGPWGHNYPHRGAPGPAIGFLQECLRWWDRWLKGIGTGIDAEPMLRAWMLESVPPAASHADWPGRWVAEPAWPPAAGEARRWFLGDGRLEDEPAAAGARRIVGRQTTGRDGGIWCPYGAPGDFPPDQRNEDGASLSFTSAPLAEPLEILGFPEARLRISVDRPNALVAVRLCDVAPDGASTLVTRGQLNLTHREGHEQPTPLVPGEWYDIAVPLNAIAWSFPAGHRLRLAVSPTYWPHAWPSPESVALTLDGGASTLTLPVRHAAALDATLPPFGPPEAAPSDESVALRGASPTRVEHHEDVIAGTLVSTYFQDRGRRRLTASGVELEAVGTESYEIQAADPLTATSRSRHVCALGHGEWSVRVEAAATMTADATRFLVSNALDAYEGETRVFARSWTCSIPRDHV